jgi:hypothetical protein
VTARQRISKPLDSTPRERAFHVVALMRREHLSLRGASDLARTDPRTVRRHAGRALRPKGRRWAATTYDRYPREMTVLTREGPTGFTIQDSRTASLVAEHANAVAAYIETGDEAQLPRLRRSQIRIRGQPVRLETDPLRLEWLAAGSELHYELYRN